MKRKTPCPVLNGIDRPDAYRKIFKGRRLGLVTGPTGLDRSLRPTIDRLRESGDLRALFSPEHGLYGEAQAGDHVASATDARTGLPVHSLYGESRDLDPRTVAEIDLLVFDMQDVGIRYYTFPYTLSNIMASCARLGLPLVVLDRVNPLGGAVVGGNVLDPRFSSFVGKFALPVRHGLTLGEFARWVNRETAPACDLTVIPCENWHRGLLFPETGLPWVMPSPNMPAVDTLLCYAGTCLFEGTNLSEGRGTTKPFELIGAPFVDAWRLADDMNAQSLPGVLFRAAFFRPAFSKHAGATCGGVQLHVTDPERFDGFRTGLRLLDTLRRTSPDFAFLETKPGRFFIDLLAGTDALRAPDFEPEAFIGAGRPAVEAFRRDREGVLLYGG